MSNDKKTLADAQPGGRVRLGDARRQWLEIRGLASAIVKNLEAFAASPHKAAWCGALDDSLTFADQIERDAAAAYEAALSAQPSQGGQGELVQEALEYFERAGDAGDRKYVAAIRGALAARQPVADQHQDDRAVDAFAAAMKAKMAEARAKGRGGWEDPAQCTADDLSRMLRDHVDKGDPRDVANFCMMLHQRGDAIAARQPVGEHGEGDEFLAGVCVALQCVTAQDSGVLWAEIVRAVGVDDLLQYATFTEPAEWDLAGFSTYASIELNRRRPRSKAAKQAKRPRPQAVHHQAALLAEERAHGNTIDQRDRCEEVADELAARIASITGVDIGEHSSANCPWQNAIEAAEAYRPAQAVDLGRWSQRHADDLHEAVHTALSVHAGSLSQKKRAAISAYVKRLLIDSQAVGNG
ncbi:TPA: hypothetical protein ACKQC2_001083 [Stenotrophomonas maltophilia]